MNKPKLINSPELSALKTLKNHYYKLFIATNNTKYHDTYKKVRNRYTNCFRYHKQQHLTNKIKNNQGNAKGMWKVLRHLLPSKIRSGISTLEVDGVSITSGKKIANIFNKYFIGVGSSLASAIPQVDIDPMSYLNKYLLKHKTPGFKFSCVNIDIVNNLFNNLPVNKATGIDGYQASLLKMCAPSLGPSLVLLFNKSLTLGSFPSSFKRGKVTPLFKSNSKLEPGN